MKKREKTKTEDKSEKTILDTIPVLESLLSSITIDNDKSIIGGNPIYMRTLSHENIIIIENKLIELVKRL